MPQSMSPLRYPSNSIQKIDSLALALQTSTKELNEVSAIASELYHQNRPKPKPDGSSRITFNPHPNLKAIQKRIKSEILDKVIYPDYLKGGVRGGSPKANAAIHIGAKLLICEDIKKFYPSVTADVVYNIWRYFFGFSKPVSDLLTKLTTRNDELPQGAPTSAHLANLVFWDLEPALNAELKELGFKYSRYIDDIAVSSNIDISNEAISDVVSRIYAMLAKKGLRAKNAKHEVTRRNQPMIVTKLVVNDRPSIPRRERDKIRAAVFEIERAFQNQPFLPELGKKLISLSGRVSYLGSLHPKMAQPLKARLVELKRKIEANQ